MKQFREIDQWVAAVGVFNVIVVLEKFFGLVFLGSAAICASWKDDLKNLWLFWKFRDVLVASIMRFLYERGFIIIVSFEWITPDMFDKDILRWMGNFKRENISIYQILSFFEINIATSDNKRTFLISILNFRSITGSASISVLLTFASLIELLSWEYLRILQNMWENTLIICFNEFTVHHAYQRFTTLFFEIIP